MSPLPHRSGSLRIKLTLWYALVFSSIQVLLLWIIVRYRGDIVDNSFRAEVTTSAEVMVDNILNMEVLTKRPAPTEDELDDLIPRGSGFAMFVIRDAEGGVLQKWNVTDTDRIPFDEFDTAPSGPVGPAFREVPRELALDLTGEPQLELLTVPFRYDGRDYYFQAAVPNPLLQRRLGPFLELATIGVPLGVVAALILAWLIAGRAVSPIHKLSVAAKAVSPTSLGERLQLDTTDDEISDLQRELNSALERLEAGYAAQEQFISNVSHELKTPIAVLLTESQVVELGEESVDKYREYAARVKEEMQGLGRLVESFLTLTRSDLAKGVTFAQSTPVNDIVLESVQHSSSLADRRGVRLIPHLAVPDGGDGDLELAGDPELLRTMLDNLIRNAIRHSPRHAPVDIVVECSTRATLITVRDRGPGIPEEYLDRVFDRFVQVPGNPADARGTGLGLTIARNIAQLHEGRIDVANNEGDGCSFSVRLPLRPAVEKTG